MTTAAELLASTVPELDFEKLYEIVARVGNVHPVADLFPMLAGEEREHLVADIKANGLVQPIVLDKARVLLDGRNRLTACVEAGVELKFITFEGSDPVAFILSSNVARRHMSQSQRAMAVAKARFFSSGKIAEVAESAGVALSTVGKASVVLQYAPELAHAVLEGASLNDAYDEAVRRKRLPIDLIQRRQYEEAYETWQSAASQEIGPEVPLPSEFTRRTMRRLDAESMVLRRLVNVRRELQELATAEQPEATSESQTMAVHAAISHIVTAAYVIAERYRGRAAG